MRITGGKYCGRHIDVENGSMPIRPAMDRMRESIFSILGPLDGLSFLDLFTGSGVIAVEAASRGASPVSCVEKDPAKSSQLFKNVSISEERIQCHIMPVELFLKRTKDHYDIIFCDPPFPYAYRQSLVQTVSTRDLLKNGGKLLMHHPKEDHLPQEIGTLAIVDQRNYGRSIVDFFQKK
jgi:16S rRNA (guanine(966)-N(2))-methyltransferase RsmD